MSESGGKVKEIVSGDDLAGITIKANGSLIEIHADGSLDVHSAGRIDAYTNGPVQVHPAADDAMAKAAPKPGDEMEDGTIYAGISPETGKPIYARPKDESGTYSFDQGEKHAKHVGEGFHVPTKNELDVLYENRHKGKLKGTFNETGSSSAGWYWSSSANYNCWPWARRFSDGYQNSHDLKFRDSSLRLVR